MQEGLAVLGFFTLVCLGIALVGWIIWVAIGAKIAWDSETDIIFMKRDINDSKSWSNEVAQRLNIIEKKLKIKREEK